MSHKWFNKPKQTNKYAPLWDRVWFVLMRNRYDLVRSIRKGDVDAAVKHAVESAHAVRQYERAIHPERFKVEA